MNVYLKELTNLISNGSMENTYKMSWIRSIVETCEVSPKNIIHFDELSPLIFKYYWNQTIFFNLKQGPNTNKKPKILQLVEKSIDEYQSIYGNKPETFIKIQKKVDIPVRQISTVLTKDVCERFLKIEGKVFDIYEPDLRKRTINIVKPEILKEYSDILYQLINYRWTQKLEDIDGSPRISKKIKGVDRDEKPRRGSLKPFQKFLDVENPSKRCFITGKTIPKEKLSIDHVIPWSYIFSNDLWNLVYVNKDRNSSKGNRLPDEDMVNRLEKRNVNLLGLLRGSSLKGKHIEELEISIKNNDLRHHWVGFKG